MSGWFGWLLVALLLWLAVAAFVAFALALVFSWSSRLDEGEPAAETPVEAQRRAAARRSLGSTPTRVLVVEDDAPFRSLLAATLSGETFELAEAGTVEEARSALGRLRPDVVLLDVSLPGEHGLVLCAELQQLEEAPRVVLLTGTDVNEKLARSAGADAVLRKPFSPLVLLETIEHLTAPVTAAEAAPFDPPAEDQSEQLIVYARDLARVVAVERAQRQLLENAYRQTITAFASALEARDTGTKIHSLRVTRVALELAEHAWPDLLDDPSVVYGLLLHDIGKIAVPDRILLKRGPLEPTERELMQRHPGVGERMLADVALLQREGLQIIRSHHERWDGTGYPERLAGGAIPRGARLCAVADALDAITHDRPYRSARDWGAAIEEIVLQSGRQFDPQVVDALLLREATVRTIHKETAQAA